MAEDKTKTKQAGSPNKDKDQSLVDDVGLPDMGEGEDLSEGGQGGAGAGQAPITEAGISPELQEIMVKKGLKSPAEIAGLLKNLEQKNTELGQELRVANHKTTLVPQPLAQPGPMPGIQGRRKVTIPEDPYQLMTDKHKFTEFINEIDQVIEDRAATAVNADKYERLRRQTVRLVNKDPVKFESLRPTMLQLSQSEEFKEADMTELYSEAEKRQVDIEKSRSEEMLKSIGLDPDDIKNLKTLTSKMRPANISSASGGGQQRVTGTEKEEAEKKIKEAILGSTVITD